MTSVLIILQILLVVMITIAVLLQKSSSIGLGAYSGSNESLFGAKGPAGFLAKFTFVLGIFLIANTIALSYVYNTANKDSLAEKIAAPSAPNPANSGNLAPQAPAAPQNAVPQAPVNPATPQNAVPSAPANSATPAAPVNPAPAENATPQTPVNSGENTPQNATK